MFMHNINDFNRVRQKMLEIMYQFGKIDALSKEIMTDVDSESIDELIKNIQEYQSNNDKLQSYLHDYITKIIDTEDNNLNLEDTEDGYKI